MSSFNYIVFFLFFLRHTVYRYSCTHKFFSITIVSFLLPKSNDKYSYLLPVGKQIRLFMHFDWLIAAPYFTVFVTFICMTDFRKQQTLNWYLCNYASKWNWLQANRLYKIFIIQNLATFQLRGRKNWTKKNHNKL